MTTLSAAILKRRCDVLRVRYYGESLQNARSSLDGAATSSKIFRIATSQLAKPTYIRHRAITSKVQRPNSPSVYGAGTFRRKIRPLASFHRRRRINPTRKKIPPRREIRAISDTHRVLYQPTAHIPRKNVVFRKR